MRKIAFLLTVLIMTALFITACDKDNPTSPADSGKHKFLITNVVGESSYLGTFKDLEQKNIDNKDSYEHYKGVKPVIYEDMIFLTEYMMGDIIHKYIRDGNGKISPAGTLSMSAGSIIAEIIFVDKNKAYVIMSGLGKLAIINPTTMKKTGEIDLTQYAVGDNNPDPGAAIIRDGKLFVALNQLKSMMSAHDSAYVAIIDIATETVDKVIIDSRVTSIGNDYNSGVFMDENNDIYFYGEALSGYQPDAKEGFLRIKNGETDWDPNYYFSIKSTNFPDVPGNLGSYTQVTKYTENGIVYAMAMIPGLTSSPPDYVNDKNYQPCKIDVYNKTIEKIDLPPTAGWASLGIAVQDDNVIFAMSTAVGNGLFTYNQLSGETSNSPVVTTEGLPLLLFYLGE